GHRYASVLIELQECPVPMHEERHVVRCLEKRVLCRDPLLVSVQKVRSADIHRRYVQRAQTIKLREALFVHDRAEMSRHGDPSLGIDPVHCIRQKSVHCALQPLPPPCPSTLVPLRPSAAPRCPDHRSRQTQSSPLRPGDGPTAESTYDSELKRELDWV